MTTVYFDRAPKFMFKDGLHFLKPRGPTMPISESYVSIPPALVIRDPDGAIWTLGFDQGGWRTGEYEYDVIRCGPEPDAKPQATGEYACRIEIRAGKVKIFGQDRWRTWNGRGFI